MVSIWETQIKIDLGKLKLALPLEQLVGDQQRANSIVLLPISVEHIFALQGLPSLHRDPFDRLLVSQAFVEDLSIMTADDAVRAYPARFTV